jgi:hypothetical protein
MNMQAEIQGRPVMAFRTGAIVVASVSGFYALVTLFLGSPLEFGVAVATCGACWVAADFVEWTVEREWAAAKRPEPTALVKSAYGSRCPVRVRADESFSRPPHSRMSSGYRVAGC